MEDKELKAIQEAISRQFTNNYPQIYIQDLQSGRVFEYGKNCHDRLVISEDGRSLYYENLQNGDGSRFGDYRFYYEKPKIETEMDKMHEYDIDHWSRNVKNKSLDKLAEFEDFMEKNGFESIQQLQNALIGKFQNHLDQRYELFKKLEQQNKILKDRWEKLREYIIELHEKFMGSNGFSYNGQHLIRKMKELEKENYGGNNN